jgi:hypothetical protein
MINKFGQCQNKVMVEAVFLKSQALWHDSEATSFNKSKDADSYG